MCINVQAEQHEYTSVTEGKAATYNSNHLVNQELADKCGLSKGPSMLCYKCEPQSVSENSRYKPYYDRPIITDRSIANNRPDVVVFDKTIKETYLNFGSLAVSLCATSLKVQNFYILPTEYLYALYVCQ